MTSGPRACATGLQLPPLLGDRPAALGLTWGLKWVKINFGPITQLPILLRQLRSFDRAYPGAVMTWKCICIRSSIYRLYPCLHDGFAMKTGITVLWRSIAVAVEWACCPLLCVFAKGWYQSIYTEYRLLDHELYRLSCIVRCTANNMLLLFNATTWCMTVNYLNSSY